MIDLKPSYSCDGCGCRKQAANHWFVVDVGTEAGARAETVFVVRSWSDERAKTGEAHVCGESCACKAFSYFLEHKSLKGFHVTDSTI